jgi:hypothetical protein
MLLIRSWSKVLQDYMEGASAQTEGSKEASQGKRHLNLGKKERPSWWGIIYKDREEGREMRVERVTDPQPRRSP